MAMTSPDPLTPGDATAPDFFATAFLNLRDTVKWMMAAAATVAAILAAGLQIKELGNLAGSPLRLAAAAGAALVALLLVLSVVAAAVRVLAGLQPVVRDLSARELKAGASALQVRLEPVGDKLVQSKLEQRTISSGSMSQSRSSIASTSPCHSTGLVPVVVLTR